MGLDESDSEYVRFLLDWVTIAFADNSFELFIVGDKGVDVIASDKVKRPISRFCGIDEPLVADFCHQGRLVDVSLPI